MAPLIAIGSAIAAATPAWLPTAAAVASTAAGGALAYGSANKQASMQKMAGERNALELERAATEAMGAGLRKANERRMQQEHIESRQRAIAASGGAGTSEGEGYLDIVGDTAERGAYLQGLEVASGRQQEASLLDSAAIQRWKGDGMADLSRAKGTAALIDAGFNIAATGLKRAPVAKTANADDFVFEEYGNKVNDGLYTGAYPPTKKKYRYG